ncbi:MAG: phosphomannomutase/phosphoglucomutase, partial [Acidimicrobiales bacterium]
MVDIDAVFKAYDVRGLVPEQLDAELCGRIGAAFAKFAKSDDDSVDRVLIGRDMRPTGTELVAAFAAGVRAQGLDTVELGLASTDLLYFASGSLGAPGAMFTASHNPAGYNGIKFCLGGARPVGDESGLAVIKEDARGELSPVGTPGTASEMDVLDAFVEHVHGFIDVDTLRPLKVVADVANGMGGLVVPAAFAALPIDLEVMYPELDGTFPNHPADPIQPENQVDLQARVVEVGADVGLAFDGDADRVFLVDELGNGLSGSTTTALVAASVLKRNPGAKIIHNLICSRALAEVVTELGGEPVRSRVGHSFIKADMADTGAAFGGEHSAHYYFRDNWRADSGLIASLVVLEVLSETGEPLSELRKQYERYAASGEI